MLVTLEQLLNFVLPCPCAICGRPPAALCESCKTEIALDLHEVRRGSLVGWAATRYEAVAADSIVAYKDQGYASLSGVMANLLQPALEAALGGTGQSPGLVTICPMPSKRASFLRRGFNPTELFSRQAAKQMRMPSAPTDALRVVGDVADQASLDHDGRLANLQGALRASVWFKGRSVLLVDDIVTTGASLIEAARAIEAVGGQVIGFCTIAETMLRIPARNQK